MLNYRNEIQMAANTLDHRRVQPSLNTGPLKSHLKPNVKYQQTQMYIVIWLFHYE